MAEIRESVIVEAVRSPIGKRNGSLKGMHPVDLLSEVLKKQVTRSGVDPGLIEDNITGCVSQVGERLIEVRFSHRLEPARRAYPARHEPALDEG